jgi:hypothetical protein
MTHFPLLFALFDSKQKWRWWWRIFSMFVYNMKVFHRLIKYPSSIFECYNNFSVHCMFMLSVTHQLLLYINCIEELVFFLLLLLIDLAFNRGNKKEKKIFKWHSFKRLVSFLINTVIQQSTKMKAKPKNILFKFW